MTDVIAAQHQQYRFLGERDWFWQYWRHIVQKISAWLRTGELLLAEMIHKQCIYSFEIDFKQTHQELRDLPVHSLGHMGIA